MSWKSLISHHGRCARSLLFMAIIARVSLGYDGSLMDLTMAAQRSNQRSVRGNLHAELPESPEAAELFKNPEGFIRSFTSGEIFLHPSPRSCSSLCLGSMAASSLLSAPLHLCQNLFSTTASGWNQKHPHVSSEQCFYPGAKSS